MPHKNPEVRKKYLKDYRSRNKDFVARLQRDFYVANADRLRSYACEWRRKISDDVKKWFGGVCACCGEGWLDMLTLDHKANDGGGMKRAHHQSTYYRIWKAFMTGDVPAIGEILKSFDNLCWNCNLSKRHGGICRHKRGPLSGEGEQYRTVYMRNSQRRAVALLGGKCVCCAEGEPEFLCVEHINNDGHLARRNKNGTRDAYSDYFAILRAFREKDGPAILAVRAKFQAMCHNCNQSKRINGVCLHKRPVATRHGEFPYATLVPTGTCG